MFIISAMVCVVPVMNC